MKRFEAIALILVLGLLIHRIFIGIDLQVLLRVVLTIISIFYMWFGLFLFNKLRIPDLFSKQKRTHLSGFQITTSILFGFLYSFSFIAINFAVNFYNGMNTMVILALFFNFGILATVLLFRSSPQTGKSYLKQFIWRSLVLVFIFLVNWLTPVEKRLNTLYKDHPAFIQAYNNYLEDPDNPEVVEKLKEERSAFR